MTSLYLAWPLSPLAKVKSVSDGTYQHSSPEVGLWRMACTKRSTAKYDPMLLVHPLSRMTKVGLSSGLSTRCRPPVVAKLLIAYG